MPGFYRLPEIYTPWWYLLLGRHGNCVSSILYQISWFILSVSFTFRTRLIQTWSSTLEIHKCTAVLIRIVMLQRSELYTDAIRLRAYGSDTYLMTLQNWSTSVNLSVSFTKGNGTVSCLNIFGCVVEQLAHADPSCSTTLTFFSHSSIHLSTSFNILRYKGNSSQSLWSFYINPALLCSINQVL